MKEVIKHLQTLLVCEQFVVTGSYAMAEMGLPVGVPNDLDIIVVKPSEITEKMLVQIQEGYKKTNQLKEYPDDHSPYIFEVLNTKINVWVQTVKIPVVWDADKTVMLSTIDGIIKAKKSYGGLKHLLQLKFLSEFFFEQPKLDLWMKNKQKQLMEYGVKSDLVVPSIPQTQKK